MHSIGRFRRSWNNPGYGPQSFKKVRTGNKWFECFNLNKGFGRSEKIHCPVMKYFLYSLFMAFSHACKISTRNGRFNAIPITLGTAIIVSSSGTIYWAKFFGMGFFLDRRGAFS